MTISVPRQISVDWRTPLWGIAASVILYVVAWAIFKAYAYVLVPNPNLRVEYYTHLGWVPLGLLVGQGLVSSMTRKPTLTLLVFLVIIPIYSQGMSWSGPNEDLFFAERLFRFREVICAILPFAMALIASVIVSKRKNSS